MKPQYVALGLCTSFLVLLTSVLSPKPALAGWETSLGKAVGKFLTNPGLLAALFVGFWIIFGIIALVSKGKS